MKVRRVLTHRNGNTHRQEQINGTSPQNNNQQSHQTKERNMAIVLICIVVMFITCQSLKIIPDLYEAFGEYFKVLLIMYVVCQAF